MLLSHSLCIADIFDPRADTVGESDDGKDISMLQSQENSVTLIQNTIKSFGPLTTKWSGLTGADLIPRYGGMTNK